MSARLQALKQKSEKRRKLLAQQKRVHGFWKLSADKLKADVQSLGITDPENLVDALQGKGENDELPRKVDKGHDDEQCSSSDRSSSWSTSSSHTELGHAPARTKPPVAGGAAVAQPVAAADAAAAASSQTAPHLTSAAQHPLAARQEDVQQWQLQLERKDEEHTDDPAVYVDSSTFLKGTQSANPHNDYCQHFLDTGERPQNFIRDVGLANRFEEYPKLRELIKLKDELVQTTATPPMYLKCDLETFDVDELQCQFDVILIEPPLEEYQRSHGIVYDKYWAWDEILNLEIEKVAASRSFLWIWCGSSEGLDMGRQCLKRWGFRRCEDICWIKTNIKNPGHSKNIGPMQIFQRTKEHCLMGIKGTVRRSTDADFIHANVDIDLIIEEEPPYGSKDKPVEIFHIAEHFCLGRRRLHLFGRDSTIRPGWLTVGPELTSSNFDATAYRSFFTREPIGYLTGCTEEIERLRPKSPPPKTKPGGGGPSDGGLMGRSDRGRGIGSGGLLRGGQLPRGFGGPRGGGRRGGRGPSNTFLGRGGFRGWTG